MTDTWDICCCPKNCTRMTGQGRTIRFQSDRVGQIQLGFQNFPQLHASAPPLNCTLINSSTDLAKFPSEPQAVVAASINYRSEQNARKKQKMHKKCKKVLARNRDCKKIAKCARKPKISGTACIECKPSRGKLENSEQIFKILKKFCCLCFDVR